MADFAHLTRASDVTRDDIIAAADSRAGCERFLDRLALIARPNEGAAVVLLVFARMATMASEWLDGDLRISLTAAGHSTVVDVQAALVVDLAERVFPRHTLAVPLVELELAMARTPQMILPLSVAREPGRVRLAAPRAVRASTAPPSLRRELAANRIPRAPRLPRFGVAAATVSPTPRARARNESSAPLSSHPARRTLPYLP